MDHQLSSMAAVLANSSALLRAAAAINQTVGPAQGIVRDILRSSLNLSHFAQAVLRGSGSSMLFNLPMFTFPGAFPEEGC